MTYNGIDFSNLIQILAVNRSIGNEREVKTDDAPKIGENLQTVKTKAKIIEVEFSLTSFNLADIKFVDTNEDQDIDFGNINKKREEIAGYFHLEEPARLTFSDEPDRYYLAIVKGLTDLTGITSWYDHAKVTFLIPDGVAHATTFKEFTSATAESSSNKYTFTIDNKGTVPAYPIIEVKHKTENGYIGLVNKDTVLELGNIEEGDAGEFKNSEPLMDFRGPDKIQQFYNLGRKGQGVFNDDFQVFNGSLQVHRNWWGRNHMTVNSRGRGNGVRQPLSGGSIQVDIPADSTGQRGALNEYIWWRQVFWAGTVRQKGVMKITVSDEQGRFLYGVETIKRSFGLDTEYNFFVSNGQGGYRILKSWTFKATHQDHENPFNHPRGWSDLMRRDDMVQVYWWGTYNKFLVPEIKGRKSAKINVFIGGFEGADLISHNYLDEFYYQKDFVTSWKDIPNRYPQLSTVKIDSEKDRVEVDGIYKINDVVSGSEFIKIPPGESTLEAHFSSWINQKPDVTIRFEERWL